MSVEAALIMPMVLCILAAVIYASFLLYDRCVYDQDAYLVCLREAVRKDSRNELDPSRVRAGIRRQAGEKYVGLGSMQGDAWVKKDTVHYEGYAAVNHAAVQGNPLLPEGIWKVAVRAGSTREDIPLYIRRYRRIRSVLHRTAAQGQQEGDNG